MKSGQWLDARIDAYKLQSKLDPVLRLITTNGFQIAWNHDFDTLDPRLTWRSPNEQQVILQVFGFIYPANAEIQLSGGAAGVYRLHLKNDAPPEAACNEREPNDDFKTARPLTLSESVSGALSANGDQDHYRVTLAKDQTIEAQVAAAELGSPLDPLVILQDGNGKELARNDDASDATRDSRLEWKAPADADYQVVVGSLIHSTTPQFTYQLNVRPLSPDFSANVPEHAFAFTQGETNLVKVNLKRLRGFTNDVSLRFDGLPEGVISDRVSVDAKGGEVNLSVVTATNAPPWSGPVNIVAVTSGLPGERPVNYELVSRSVDNGVPGGYSKLLLEETPHVWLTIKAKVPEKK
jgi:hypothetical protein